MSAIRRLGEVSRAEYGDAVLWTRFWEKVYPCPITGCWNWGAARTAAGYGSAWDSKRKAVDYAHRIAYRALVAEVPAGLELDHLCRVRSCVNPAHLEAVTHSENVRRGEAWHGIAAAEREKTHCKHGHEFSPENTYRPPAGKRACKTCKAAVLRRWRQRNIAKRGAA
jgi:hypothetical protein